MGYRDIVQHAMGCSSFYPARTREILLTAFRHQYSSGLALRGWNPIDTKEYAFPDNTVIADRFRLESVKGILMPAGLYMFCEYTALDGATEEQAYDDVCDSEFVQPDGDHYPTSMDLTGCVWDLENWPAVEVREMTSLDHFPEEIGLRMHEKDKDIMLLKLKD